MRQKHRSSHCPERNGLTTYKWRSTFKTHHALYGLPPAHLVGLSHGKGHRLRLQLPVCGQHTSLPSPGISSGLTFSVQWLSESVEKCLKARTSNMANLFFFLIPLLLPSPCQLSLLPSTSSLPSLLHWLQGIKVLPSSPTIPSPPRLLWPPASDRTFCRPCSRISRLLFSRLLLGNFELSFSNTMILAVF